MKTEKEQLESLDEMIKKLAEDVTDYGFNDEYGYYNDWKDGVKPILEKSIKPFILSQRKADMEALMSEVANAIEENTAFYEQKYGGNYEQCGRDIKFSIAQALEAQTILKETFNHNKE